MNLANFQEHFFIEQLRWLLLWDFISNLMSAFTAQKMEFSIMDFFRNVTKSAETDLVTFTEEILNGKLHFLCSVW